MSKDPSFLFYVNDFLSGTMFMTNEQVGIYIKLLCVQHQHGGIIDKDNFKFVSNGHNLIKDKFIETEDGFFNVKMAKVMEERAKKSKNMSDNAMERWNEHKAMQKQCKSNATAMQPKDVDKDVDKDIVKDITNTIEHNISIDNKSMIYKYIIDDLNSILNTSYKNTTLKTQTLIKARLKEGRTLEDFKKVHRTKHKEWKNDPKMSTFLRPETLYSDKFESYLQQSEKRSGYVRVG